MNMLALQFRKQLDAHLRRAGEEGRDGTQILDTLLTLLRSILDDYVGQLPQIPVIDIRVVD